MPYVTVDDMRAEGVPASYSDDRIESRIVLAETYVESETGQWFDPREQTLTFDGNGDRVLLLPICLLEVTSITVDEVELTDDELADITNYNRRPPGPDDRRNPKLVRGVGSIWPTGTQNIVIEGTWGYVEADDSTPLLIIEAVKRLVIRNLDLLADASAQAERREATYGTSFTTHNRSVTLGSAAVSGGPTGDPEIDRVLKRYRKPLDGVIVGA